MSSLMKSQNNKWFDGVLGGFGEYFNLNPDLVRIGFLIGVFILNIGFLVPLYILMAILLPRRRGPEAVKEGKASRRTGDNSQQFLQLIGLILIVAGLIYLGQRQFPTLWRDLNSYLNSYNYYFRRFREGIIGLLLIGGGVWLVWKKRKDQ